jgi:hypothetical protein
MAVAYLLISWSLPNNGYACHNMQNFVVAFLEDMVTTNMDTEVIFRNVYKNVEMYGKTNISKR